MPPTIANTIPTKSVPIQSTTKPNITDFQFKSIFINSPVPKLSS